MGRESYLGKTRFVRSGPCGTLGRVFSGDCGCDSCYIGIEEVRGDQEGSQLHLGPRYSHQGARSVLQLCRCGNCTCRLDLGKQCTKQLPQEAELITVVGDNLIILGNTPFPMPWMAPSQAQ